jgi:hypothetical protein
MIWLQVESRKYDYAVSKASELTRSLVQVVPLISSACALRLDQTVGP